MGSESIADEAEGRMGYRLRDHEGERNNCFSKIQPVGQKYRDKTTLASKTRLIRHCFGFQSRRFSLLVILGDPGADSGDEGKSKRVEKCGAKKRKERREEPLGTMSYQTSSKRSPLFWLLIGARKTQVFWHQSEARTAATVWNWSGKTLSPGALLAVLYFSSRHIFPPVFRLSLVLAICPWVSEDGY